MKKEKFNNLLKDMKQLNEQYTKNQNAENWRKLIKQEKSKTKKQLEYYIKESSNNKYSLDDIYITNAIMCAIYHPVAQVKKNEQLEQYKRIWKYIEQ